MSLKLKLDWRFLDGVPIEEETTVDQFFFIVTSVRHEVRQAITFYYSSFIFI